MRRSTQSRAWWLGMHAAVTGDRRTGGQVIGTTLATVERRLVALLAEQHDGLELTHTDDSVAELDEVIRPVLNALRAAASRVDAATPTRSLRRSAAATLSIVWVDLVELAPDRLAAAWGAEVPEDWPALHAELLALLRWAEDRVERRTDR